MYDNPAIQDSAEWTTHRGSGSLEVLKCIGISTLHAAAVAGTVLRLRYCNPDLSALVVIDVL